MRHSISLHWPHSPWNYIKLLMIQTYLVKNVFAVFELNEFLFVDKRIQTNWTVPRKVECFIFEEIISKCDFLQTFDDFHKLQIFPFCADKMRNFTSATRISVLWILGSLMSSSNKEDGFFGTASIKAALPQFMQDQFICLNYKLS